MTRKCRAYLIIYFKDLKATLAQADKKNRIEDDAPPLFLEESG